MQWVATGLLLAAAAVYALATWLEPRHPWLFYVSATAEAAMIGAVADWFAVTALFRHPLNLRFIPHTAVIPRNKARIASGLSSFIQQNFLSGDAVVARIAAFRPARTLCGWLLQPRNADMLGGYCARMLPYVLGAVDDRRVRAIVISCLLNCEVLTPATDLSGREIERAFHIARNGVAREVLGEIPPALVPHFAR
jgi:uncharacterized membrane-anchored protein YjiN (DUF445 family)